MNATHENHNMISNSHTLEVLRYWHRLEFFVPFNLDEARSHTHSHYLDLSEQQLLSANAHNYLPWLSNFALAKAAAQPGRPYHYFLYLLPFNKNELTRISKIHFPPGIRTIDAVDFEERLEDEGETCFAKLYVDCKGKPDFSSLSLSTLPWALGQLINHDLSALNAKNHAEEQYRLKIAISELERHITNPESPVITDQINNETLSVQGLLALVDILKKWAGFETEHPLICMIELREYKGRTELANLKQISGQSATPGNEFVESLECIPPSAEEMEAVDDEPLSILNSFFIEDIEKIINSLNVDNHPGIDHYINGIDESLRTDVYSEAGQAFVIDKLNPAYMNHGRWPENNTHFMSLMQQLAINESFFPSSRGSLFSVNGPPGTGKTTMLKDIIAENILRRAKILSGFKTPDACFIERKSISFNSEQDLKIGILDPRLTGHEMIVASTNNAAVENISKDLPLKHNLGSEYQNQCTYLAPVAAKIMADHKNASVKKLENRLQPWGLISIALGNAKNRTKFVERVFFAPEENDAERNRRIKEGGYLTIWEWRRNYRGPSFSDAKSAFLEHEKKLNTYFAKIQLLANLHSGLEDPFELAKTTKQKNALDEIQIVVTNLDVDISLLDIELNKIKSDKAQIYFDLDQSRQFKPGFLQRLFKTPAAMDYQSQIEPLRQRWSGLIMDEQLLQKRIMELKNRRSGHQTRMKELNLHIASALSLQNELKRQFNDLRNELHDIHIPDPALLSNPEQQRKVYWQNETLNQLRTQSFSTALALHESWLAEVLKNGSFTANILAISRLLNNKKPLSPEDEIHIWQSFFMWIPVVSSTFASIARQFSHVKSEKFGFLLIDEAGQAIPQAAVGAIWRAKRTIVVGDPRQIEPIFTVPGNLIDGLANEHFRSDHGKWSPTKTSVQILADQANAIGTHIDFAEQTQWIGAPLRVHRRCLDPMFSVANFIAYENKMIQARQNFTTEDCHFPLGKSCWFDIVANTTDRQYVSAQGQLFLKLFCRLIDHYGELPATYVITPFKRIKYHLHQLIKDPENWAPHLQNMNSLPTPAQLHHWCNRHIGTVHTFQGKEAPSVIFILGADRENPGSVAWASSKPNLLNVALTRAKDAIYIIGDVELWSKKPYFSQLIRNLHIVPSRLPILL